MAQIIKVPTFMESYIACIDDSNPPKDVQDWVKKGETYRLIGVSEALNTDSLSLIITNLKKKQLQPSRSLGGFKSDRFIARFDIYLN